MLFFIFREVQYIVLCNIASMSVHRKVSGFYILYFTAYNIQMYVHKSSMPLFGNVVLTLSENGIITR